MNFTPPRSFFHRKQLFDEFAACLHEAQEEFPAVQARWDRDFAVDADFAPGVFARSFKNWIENERRKTWRVIKDLDPATIGGASSPRILSIIQEFSRPSFLVQNNKTDFTVRPRNSIVQETSYWRNQITPHEATLADVYACIGRLELEHHPQFLQWAGTGWLLTADVIVTNRHVATLFSESNAGRWSFKRNGGSDIAVGIDYREEYQNFEKDEHAISEVIHVVEGSDQPDVAFLRLKTPVIRGPTGNGLLLSSGVHAATEVVTVGYPKYDSSMPEDPELVDRIFGGVLNVKRAAPGVIVQVRASSNLVTHDCSTLGGNSGSAVVELATGLVTGLHFGGTYTVENTAVHPDFIIGQAKTLGLLS